MATSPKGPSTQYRRTLVPKTLPLMAFGTRVLEDWVLGPLGRGEFRVVGIVQGGPRVGLALL